MGGVVPLGYALNDRHLVIDPSEAKRVKRIFDLYLELGCVMKLRQALEREGVRSKQRISGTGKSSGGGVYSRGALYSLLQNRIYRGEITHKQLSYPGQHEAIIDRDIWDRVQARFKANIKAERKRPRTTEGSLLTGLLYDAQGNRFTPSHVTKKGKRYRYYVSQEVIYGGKRSSGSGPTRLPADEIDDLVLSQLKQLLESPQKLVTLLIDPTAASHVVERSLATIKRVAGSASDCFTLSRKLLHSAALRVVIHPDRVEVHLDRRELGLAVLGPGMDPSLPCSIASDVEPIVLSEAAHFANDARGGRFQLAPDSNHARSNPLPSLTTAVARAHDWAGRILRGEIANQRALAKETGLDERYIGKILPLAFLAPDIAESILEGKQPHRLSLETFEVAFPFDWNQQRMLFQAHSTAAS